MKMLLIALGVVFLIWIVSLLIQYDIFFQTLTDHNQLVTEPLFQLCRGFLSGTVKQSQVSDTTYQKDD